MPHTKSIAPIAFDDQGRGEPALLCLPGWCIDRSAFQDLTRACSRFRRTLSLDWRGHGESAASEVDFGEEALLEDALAVIEESEIERVVPVALSHAGWAAIELRRRLGERVPAIVFLDWLVLDPPPPFIEALATLQEASHWRMTRDQLFDMWLRDVDNPKVIRMIREVMGSYGFEMWARAGRAIEGAYRREGAPLKTLAELRPPVRALHLYAQPADPEFLHAQENFAALNPWFTVKKVNAKSHLSMLEAPEDMAAAIESFLADV